MAYFAELDESKIVLRVLSVSNKDTEDKDGHENEEIGIQFLKNLFGQNTDWKQTSYNNKIRFHYAGIGFKYDDVLNAFVPPQPYPSWLLDTTSVTWVAPIPAPALTPEEQKEGYVYVWNEDIVNWILRKMPTPPEMP